MSNLDRKVIPSGRWQRWVGGGLDLFAIFPALAATPFNGAGAVATMCFAAGSSFLFWGILLKYLGAIEDKIMGLSIRERE